MQKSLKLVGFVTIIGVCLALVAFLVVNKLSITMTSRIIDTPVRPLLQAAESADKVRGAHLVEAVLGCRECHGPDMAGQILRQSEFFGSISAANLTQPKLTSEGYNRAIRQGTREDGRGLWLMPSDAYAALADADLAAVIAHLQTLPSVDKQLPQNRLNLYGRWLVASRQLHLVLAGDNPPSLPPTPQPQPNAAYGAYLARIARCHSCHGASLQGAAAHEVPRIDAEGLADWHEADFFELMRHGKRPGGPAVGDGMPWKTYAGMTDDELRALWRFCTQPAS